MAFDSEESTTPNTTGDIRPFCRVSDATELRYVSIYVMYIPDPPTCIANALETSKRESVMDMGMQTKTPFRD